MSDQLTKEDIAKAVAEAMKEHKKEQDDAKIERKFTPSTGLDGKVEVTLDAGDQPWGSLGEQLQAIVKAGSPGSPIREPRLTRSIDGAVHPVTKAVTGMGETVPSDGAFLVAQEFIPTLINRMYDTGVVFSRCAKQTVGPGFNGFKIPAIDETSRADGSRWGGVRAYWGAEAATITASKAKFRQISIELQKLFALCYVTEELLQDATALSGYVNQWFPAEMGFKLDD
ncbi:MAG: phage major capsid protein, partial [Ignavibacteria bacterium]|nr:phage major capsid protein [Ignavibacteria bacterium]